MTIKEIFSFKDLYLTFQSEKMPIKLAYKLNKLYNSLNSDLTFYETNVNKIVEEYGKVDEQGHLIQNADGSGILIKEGLVEECHQKIKDLQNIEIELPSITFTIEELEELKITPEQLQGLMPFIQE